MESPEANGEKKCDNYSLIAGRGKPLENTPWKMIPVTKNNKMLINYVL